MAMVVACVDGPTMHGRFASSSQFNVHGELAPCEHTTRASGGSDAGRPGGLHGVCGEQDAGSADSTSHGSMDSRIQGSESETAASFQNAARRSVQDECTSRVKLQLTPRLVSLAWTRRVRVRAALGTGQAANHAHTKQLDRANCPHNLSSSSPPSAFLSRRSHTVSCAPELHSTPHRRRQFSAGATTEHAASCHLDPRRASSSCRHLLSPPPHPAPPRLLPSLPPPTSPRQTTCRLYRLCEPQFSSPRLSSSHVDSPRRPGEPAA